MSAFDPHTEKQLAFSVEQYRELWLHAEKLLDMLNNCEYSQVHEHSARLQELQTAASRQDELLLPALKADLPVWEGHDLYRMRVETIQSILELNELLLPKISGMKAVFAAELDQLKGGRVAVSGYHATASRASGVSRGIG